MPHTLGPVQLNTRLEAICSVPQPDQEPSRAPRYNQECSLTLNPESRGASLALWSPESVTYLHLLTQPSILSSCQGAARHPACRVQKGLVCTAVAQERHPDPPMTTLGLSSIAAAELLPEQQRSRVGHTHSTGSGMWGLELPSLCQPAPKHATVPIAIRLTIPAPAHLDKGAACRAQSCPACTSPQSTPLIPAPARRNK